LNTTEPAPKIKCGSSQTETSETLKQFTDRNVWNTKILFTL